MSTTLDFDAIEVAEALADAARPCALAHFRGNTKIDDKGTADQFDPVTEADRSAERAMRARLAELRPQDGICGEEYGQTEGTSGWTWYLDPVDGTRAFVAGLPVWTTLIGLVDSNGDAVVGVIDQPVLDERYLGWPGGAAIKRNASRAPISVSKCQDLRHAVIATTDPFILTQSEQTAWTELREAARIVRYGLDAYAYARLAAGSIDLVAETGLAPHDTAALIPVVRGAGGYACDWRGASAKPGGQIVCATSESLLEQALVSLKPFAEG
ncbi:MAG: inositol monophosphatase family protein [Pseudomonadota bacterium]